MVIRAATYSRVSTDAQEREGTSLDTQRTACEAYCRERGYTIAAVFADTHSGADLDGRPQLSALRQALRDGAIDVVITYGGRSARR